MRSLPEKLFGGNNNQGNHVDVNDTLRCNHSPAAEAVLPVEIAFLKRHGFALAELVRIARRAARMRISPLYSLIATGWLSEETYADLLARELGLARLEPSVRPDDSESIEEIAASGIMCGTSHDGTAVKVVVPKPAMIKWLLEGHAAPMRRHLRIASQQELQLLLLSGRREAFHEAADEGMLRKCGRPTARQGLSRTQHVAADIIIVAAYTLDGVASNIASAFVEVLGALLFLALVTVRLMAILHHAKRPPACVPKLDDADLPVYTVILALCREDRVVSKLCHHLKALDYPALGSKLT